ncbi:MAG: C10 family peptidase [Kiritimatiellae bacterium]|nr:C10 family peptidase [Kiritimatiellia bacterium]
MISLVMVRESLRLLLALCCCLTPGVRTVSAAPVKAERACELARAYVARHYADGTATAGTPTARRLREQRAVAMSQAAVTLTRHGRTIGHVIPLAPEGFVLVRSDDLLPPVKLHTARGSFDDLPPLFAEVLRIELTAECEALDALQARGEKPDPRHAAQWQQLLDAGAAPLMPVTTEPLASGEILTTTAWGQGQPYNLYCPVAAGGPGGRVVAGCVAIAMSQIMRYHQHPAAIAADSVYTDNQGACQGTHRASDAGLQAYDWAAMPNTLYLDSPAAEQQAVARLVYHAGVTVTMDYEFDGSGALSTDVANALRDSFGYACDNLVLKWFYTDAKWYQKIASDIDARRPVYYSFSESDFGNGHAVVCDGYRNGDEIHLNLGWYGSYDAWYNLDTVKCAGYEWTVHYAVYGIRPQPTVSLAASLDAADLTWSTGGNAEWLGQVATTHDGTDAARSGNLRDSQESWLQTTVTGPGTLSFWWKVACEDNWDYLCLEIGGSEVARSDGFSDWQQVSVTVPAGSQTAKWRFVKDGSYSSGADCGWLDEVAFTYTPLPPAPGNLTASDGTDESCVHLSWPATGDATDYRVFRNSLDDSGGASQIGTTATNSFDDGAAAPGDVYYYWVKASNAFGDSGFSTGDSGWRAWSRILWPGGNLRFGWIQLGQTATRTLVMTNAGTATLSVHDITVAPPLSASPTSLAIPAGGHGEASVTFSATSAVSLAATVMIYSDRTGGTNTVPVSGYVGRAPALLSAPNLPDATAGRPYDTAIVMSGDPVPVLRLANGEKLPPGLRLLATGALTGTPLAAGAGGFTVAANNGFAPVFTRRLTLTVRDASTPPSVGSLIYVDATCPDDSGDGESWSTAKRTIQAGIDAAASNGLVLVMDGIYREGARPTPGGTLSNRVIVSKGITVRSLNGPLTTAIEGPGAAAFDSASAMRCVFIENGGLVGFTVRGGATRQTGDNQDCDGAGVFIGGATAQRVRDCLIGWNRARNGGGVYGGILENCTLAGNEGYAGGGANASDLRNCIISTNLAIHGGGAYNSMLSQCLVTGNRAQARGGGVFVATPLERRANSCMIVNNQAWQTGGGAYGGTLNNCTIYANYAASGGHGAFGSSLNNCIVGGSGTVSQCASVVACYTCAATELPGEGNLCAEPLFSDPDGGDLRLMAESPCRNTGWNPYAEGGEDFHGRERIQEARVDMGASEFCAATPGDIAGPDYEAWLGACGGGVGCDFRATATADLDGDGHTAGQEYEAGSLPQDAGSVFRAGIELSDGLPRITWQPDLGAARIYTVEGKSALEASWEATNAASRFFRVKVAWP